MATHILQFAFYGLEGFSFPFAFWPTTQINSDNLFNIYWEAVFALHQHDFWVHMCVCDGAQSNRSFIINHFESEAATIESNFTMKSLITGTPHTFMMDPSVSRLPALSSNFSNYEQQWEK